MLARVAGFVVRCSCVFGCFRLLNFLSRACFSEILRKTKRQPQVHKGTSTMGRGASSFAGNRSAFLLLACRMWFKPHPPDCLPHAQMLNAAPHRLCTCTRHADTCQRVTHAPIAALLRERTLLLLGDGVCDAPFARKEKAPELRAFPSHHTFTACTPLSTSPQV